MENEINNNFERRVLQDGTIIKLYIENNIIKKVVILGSNISTGSVIAKLCEGYTINQALELINSISRFEKPKSFLNNFKEMILNYNYIEPKTLRR